MLQRFREWLVLFLVILLPFHAFLVTVGTRLLVGVGQAPLPWVALWKESLLGFVLLVALTEIFLNWRKSYQYTSILIRPADVLDWLVLGLLVLGVSVSATHYSLLTTHFLFGFKYTIFPLLLFLILRRVPWSATFVLHVTRYTLLVGAAVAGYGISTLFLPQSFFTWLGYSDLHSLYLPDGPLAAFQMLEGTSLRRIQSTFAGPNQLGVWLLIPWSIAVGWWTGQCPSPLGGGYGRGGRGGGIMFFVLLLFVAAFFLTLSRAAWIGAAVILLVSVWRFVPRGRTLFRYFVVSLFGVAVFGGVVFPEVFLRGLSTREHLRRPLEAVRMIAVYPLGLGLGTAGPAANRTSDPCVFLPTGADALWAKDRPNLCVFAGDWQVQPAGHACRCPLLPENWYLQVGVELGFLGLLLFTTLVVLVIQKLVINYQLSLRPRAHLDVEPSMSRQGQVAIFNSPILLAFMGISVAALFLHAWEDASVAYTVWILLAVVLPVRRSLV